MRFEKLMTAVDSHTEGMPTRIVTSGFGQVPGHTMFEKQHYIEEHLDHLRGFLMREPRGVERAGDREDIEVCDRAGGGHKHDP